MGLNQNIYGFFCPIGKKYVFGVMQNFSNEFMCPEMKNIENRCSELSKLLLYSNAFNIKLKC